MSEGPRLPDGLPEPTWKDEEFGIALYRGDCLDILPTLPDGCVDAVVTDPPFGIGFKYESHDDDPESYGNMMRSWLSMVNARVFVVWQAMLKCDRWHEWFPNGHRLFAAAKGFVQFRPTPVQYSWDPVVFWGDPATDPSVLRKDFHEQRLAPFGAGRARIEHPCPRPLEQVEVVIDTFTKQSDLILDPFMGSGTTIVASVRLGRAAIGIELEPKYFDIAVDRIRNEIINHQGGPMFAKHEPATLCTQQADGE